MNKKFYPLLVIIILAIFITGGSYFIKVVPRSLDALTIYRGLPIPYWSQTHATFDFGRGNFPTFPPKQSWFIFFVDVLLWCLILGAVFKLIRKKNK